MIASNPNKDYCGTGKGKGHPAWNIYIAPPTKDQNALADWTITICKVWFITAANGAGKSRRIFLCLVCHSIDHPRGMCKFLTQTDWIAPPPTIPPALEGILNPTPPNPTNQNATTRRNSNCTDACNRSNNTRGRATNRT